MKFLRRRWIIVVAIVCALGSLLYFTHDYFISKYVDFCVYRQTRGLPRIDHAEVYLLGNISLKDNEKLTSGFPIKAYGTFAPIIAKETLNKPQSIELSKIWKSQTFGWDYQALCHGPVYGIRFFRGTRQVFETSICFHCSNFYVEAPFLGAGWWGFDTTKPEAKALHDFLNQLIPEELRKR